MGASFNHMDYLCHHGIKYQKWGVRRFQNPDGTYTEAGKQRYFGTTVNIKEDSRRAARAEARAERGSASDRLFEKNIKTVNIKEDSRRAAKAEAKERARQAKAAARAERGSASDRLFEKNIKAGKDKPPKSAAESIIGDVSKGVENASKLSDKAIEMRQRKAPKEDLSKYSDDDLKRMIGRLNLERQYESLRKADINSGMQKIKDVLDIVGPTVGIAASAIGIAATIHKLRHEDDNMYYISTDPGGVYLVHHGVRGQKWGIRRYQNEDGSLTPRGERHVKSGSDERGASRKEGLASRKERAKAKVSGVVEKNKQERSKETSSYKNSLTTKEIGKRQIKDALISDLKGQAALHIGSNLVRHALDLTGHTSLSNAIGVSTTIASSALGIKTIVNVGSGISKWRRGDNMARTRKTEDIARAKATRSDDKHQRDLERLSGRKKRNKAG